MSEQTTLSQSPQAVPGPQAAAGGSGPKPPQRAASDPREVAARVLAQMNQVNVKKEELGVAIRSLIDVAQQLTRAYAVQTVTVEQLRRRVKALESAVPPEVVAPEAATPPASIQ